MNLSQANIDFLNGYFSTRERSRKTKVAYTFDLAQFQRFAGEGLTLSSLNDGDIERWAAHLREEKYSPSSIRRKMVTLRVFFSYWLRKGVISESPFWRLKLSFGPLLQLPRALTETEIRALIVQAEQKHLASENKLNGMAVTLSNAISSGSKTYLALRNLAIIDLLFATGMRVGEVSSLNIQDFQAEGSVFRVQGKGGRIRLAFAVDEVTVKIQLEHLKARRQIETEKNALFLNVFGERLSTQGIANMITRLRQDAGLERHITPHMLRHTVATLLLRNGVDIRVVQEFLGHASIATTQRYTHITKEHLIEVLRNQHPSLKLRDQTGRDQLKSRRRRSPRLT